MLLRVVRWFMRLDSRVSGAIFIIFASVCLGVFFTGVVSWFITRSTYPPFEYVVRRSDETVTSANRVITFPPLAGCPGAVVTLPGYQLHINMAPITVMWTTSWRDATTGRTVIADSTPRYTSYPFKGRVDIKQVRVRIPRELPPGSYQRITSAWTAITFPEAYLVPVKVKDCRVERLR